MSKKFLLMSFKRGAWGNEDTVAVLEAAHQSVDYNKAVRLWAIEEKRTV